MPKKKILVFIDWFLPGYRAGGPIRSLANLTAHLSEQFEFLILTRNSDYLENEPYENLESDKWVDFSEGIKVYYFSKKELNLRNIKKIVSKLNFDYVYINGIYSFYFSLFPVYLFKSSVKKIIVASRGMLSSHSFSSKNQKKRIFLFIARFLGFYKNIYFHVTNSIEKKEISKLGLKTKGFIIAPNLSPKLGKQPVKSIKKQSGSLKLVSIARISIEKNILFALEVLTSNKYTGIIEFDLYGSIYEQKYWDECSKIIQKAAPNIKINYKAELQNLKVQETLQKYHFSFLPSKGENFGHSILESLMAACPVIISDKTPWENLKDKKVGWDLPLNEPGRYKEVLQYCIDMQQDEYNRISKKAFEFAKTFAEDQEIIEQSINLFKY